MNDNVVESDLALHYVETKILKTLFLFCYIPIQSNLL